MTGFLAGYRAALSSADLRRLFSALLISSTGTWAYQVALLAWVFARTHSLGWVAAAGVARLVPMLVFSVYGGVLAERTERIRLLAGSDALCLVWQALLAVVAATHGPPWVALVLVALTAVSYAAYNPAVAATIPSLAGEDELAAANALNSTIEQLVIIVGPAIGALLLAFFPAGVVFAINAASFGLSALIVLRIRARSRPVDVTEEGRAGLLRQLTVGARALASHAAARTLVGYSVLVSFVYGTDTVLLIDVSARRLGTGANGWGYLIAGLGTGGVLAAVAVDRASGSRRLGWIILAGALAYCLPTALLTVIHAPGLAFAVEVVRGAGTLFVDVLAITALQRAVSADELARVFGVYFALFMGAIALGSVLAAPLVAAAGLTTALWVMALAPAGLALLGFPALRAIDRATAARAAALAPLVAILERLEIFAAASRQVLEQLAGASTEVRFLPAATIISQGAAADALFVLVEGEVRVSASESPDGPARTIGTMGSPSYFGELGLLEQIPRTATVTAIGDCRCERIEADAFLTALSSGVASRSLIGTATARLAVTHPGRRVTYFAETDATPG